uniref:Uncharacterized protein n=1 Tax=Chromera velia CCMP2878 TaxID=1169474 RepID=A0A0G4G210_9ALVE|eukprot:Cvel_19872.t1-p1 / transcript=Cvel_19872.t1 / gene=Cvel_19872 / organism=Chromera_velia_CCMP2878 / gene_product=hypothetical protein / transcript_product=hypothetical protein / location=Cvel_scaffold1743:8261-12634(-) / protein_length=282 / sequence_SO=supercontig / SO=protein_coding / is_pseudo=false
MYRQYRVYFLPLNLIVANKVSCRGLAATLQNSRRIYENDELRGALTEIFQEVDLSLSQESAVCRLPQKVLSDVLKRFRLHAIEKLELSLMPESRYCTPVAVFRRMEREIAEISRGQNHLQKGLEIAGEPPDLQREKGGLPGEFRQAVATIGIFGHLFGQTSAMVTTFGHPFGQTPAMVATFGHPFGQASATVATFGHLFGHAGSSNGSDFRVSVRLGSGNGGNFWASCNRLAGADGPSSDNSHQGRGKTERERRQVELLVVLEVGAGGEQGVPCVWQTLKNW